MSHKDGQSLADYLEDEVFQSQESTTIEPDPEDVAGFGKFMEEYKAGLSIEQKAIDQMPVETSKED